MLVSNLEPTAPEEINCIRDHYLQNQHATLFFMKAITFLAIASKTFNALKNVTGKIVSASTLLNKRDFVQVRPLLGWLPLEVVKWTFECTTQLAMGSLLRMPFRQHHKSCTPQLNVPRLSKIFATDTLFSSEVGLDVITCAQLFVGMQSKLTKVYGLRTESQGPQAFQDFIWDNGAPYALCSNNSKMQTGISFTNILKRYIIKSEHTESKHPTQNPAERHIKD
eukprot:453688-Ditylum_brightwellii.AAC.1